MRKILFINTLVFICVIVNAQDLKLSSPISIIAPNPVHVGITINVTFSVKNIGTSGAGFSHIGIYLSPATNISSGKLLSEISLETLPAGASSNNIQFNFPIPYNAVSGSGTYYIIVNLNDDNAITETNYSNNSANAAITVDAEPWAAQNIPYPIIFIHGLIGANTTWNELIDSLQNFYGWSYGGNMNFCLNYDAKLSTSNKDSDYHDFTDISSLRADDYFTVNFDVNSDGTPYTNSAVNESNQSAIVKQGLAIRDAINHVLAITGKDKVILVGHSMGGLAAREYLQNTSLWQEPNLNHHVAKLLTIGTPHGGSNATDFGIGLEGIDILSEAIRDLRTSYIPTLKKGVYLFNGKETINYISPFYNVDVNCNGIIGESILGINNKSIPPDISYSCLIGTGDKLGGDGIVTTKSANINNFLPVNAPVFTLQKTSGIFTVWHKELTKQFAGIMKGMDEPSNNKIDTNAYTVTSGQLYYANITYQSASNSIRDTDYYKINVPSGGNLNIQVYDIPTSFYSINVFNSANVSVYSVASHGKSYISADIQVSQGNYYIVLSGIPTTDSYKYPYAFKCTFSTTTSYCSGTTTLTAVSGAFSDGSGGNNYNNNSDCKWKITPGNATSITLSFSSFNVSNPGDTVYVYDGATITSSLLGKWTGNSLPANITSTGGTMLVRFKSNATNTSAGWDASYIAHLPNSDATIISYETWFDSDYKNKQSTSITPQNNFQLDSGISTNNLSGGLHSFHIRFKDNNNLWGSAISQFFVKLPQTSGSNTISAYEYWFDNNYASKISQSITAQENYQLLGSLSISGLTQGLHSFHMRFKDSANTWSSTISQFIFYIPSNGSNAKINRYEYWFDNNYSQKSTVTVSPTALIYTLNANIATSGLSIGAHAFHIRFRQSNNLWSSVLNQGFNKTSTASIVLNNLSGDGFEYKKENQIFVYPNPSTGKFVVSIDDSIKAKSISIMDGLGNKIHFISIDSKNKKDIYNFDLSNVSSGTYYVNIYDGRKRFVQKIIVAK